MNDIAEHLPVVDLSDKTSRTSRQLLEAASRWGFVYIKATGLCISSSDVDRAFEMVWILES